MQRSRGRGCGSKARREDGGLGLWSLSGSGCTAVFFWDLSTPAALDSSLMFTFSLTLKWLSMNFCFFEIGKNASVIPEESLFSPGHRRESFRGQ